jgi:hypothetical protein
MKVIKENIIGKNLAKALSSKDITIIFRQYNQLGSINIINLPLSLKKDIYKLGLILDTINLLINSKKGKGPK